MQIIIPLRNFSSNQKKTIKNYSQDFPSFGGFSLMYKSSNVPLAFMFYIFKITLKLFHKKFFAVFCLKRNKVIALPARGIFVDISRKHYFETNLGFLLKIIHGKNSLIKNSRNQNSNDKFSVPITCLWNFRCSLIDNCLQSKFPMFKEGF